MMLKPHNAHRVRLLCLFILLLAAETASPAEESRNDSCRILETRHTIIYYQSQSDLERMDNSIRFSPADMGLKSLFSFSSPADPAVSIQQKVDAIFERVQEILDMRARMNKVRINVVPNKEALARLYARMTGKTLQIRAWYVYQAHAIYLNAADVHEGILAHEFAHAVIDCYFAVRPPRATAEILSRYVDEHLY